MFKLILIFLTGLLLTGCTNNETVQEVPTDEEISVIDESLPVSIYFAIREGLDDNRWQNFITISVNSDDIITDISLNSISQLANNSRRNVAQLEGFEDLFEYDFHEQADMLEEMLIGTSRHDLADALLAAYTDELVDFNAAEFADLATIALAATPIEIGSYVDGIYMSLSTDDGYPNYFVYLFVINGHIQAIHFNAFNSDDSLKYDIFSETTLSEEVTLWRYQAELFERSLLETQDPLVYTFCEDGFTTDIPGFYFNVMPFINLVTDALSRNPITNP